MNILGLISQLIGIKTLRLTDAIDDIFPHAQHRLCAKHVYNNF